MICQGEKKRIPVAMRKRETPVPISNTMVKPHTADGTILETIWESRWLPDYKKKCHTVTKIFIRTDSYKI